MTAESGTRTRELFHELLDLPSDARRVRLDAIRRQDASLADHLRRLLDAAEAEQVDDAFSAAVEVLIDEPLLEAGRHVGPYRIVDELGAGGMGVVYRARHEETEREVAIKVVSHGWAWPLDHERLVREYRLVARLDDEPRVARLYEVGTLEDGTAWFAMELVAGALPITDYCEQQQLPIVRRLELFRDVCRAVKHAHSRAIVHRDLKPSNVLVSEAGEVKLLDFGIAGVLAELNEESEQACGSARSLTPAYAAPEQLSGQPVGTFTDLYVLGLLLYELLTQSRPFDLEGRSVSEVREIVTGQPPSPPSVVRARRGLGFECADWGDLDGICLTLLAAAPAARYDGIDRLLTDIDHYLTGRPVSVRSASRAYRARKLVGRHRAAVATTAAALIAVIVLTTAYGLRLAAERRATLAQVARTERLQQFMLGLFSGAEPAAGPASQLTVRRLLDRGVLTAEILTRDPDIQADLEHTLGVIYGQLGDFGRAESLLTRLLDNQRQRLPADDLRVIDWRVSLALLRIDQMRLDDAERLAREALVALQRLGHDDSPVALRASLALGRALTNKGAYAPAIAELEPRVRVLDPAGLGTSDQASVVAELATAHQYSGHAEDADRLNRQALAMQRRVHGDKHPAVADVLINLADADSSRGRYAAAETRLRESVAIYTSWYGRDHPETASATRILAQALVGQERLAEAEALLEEARDIFTRVYPEPHRRLGLIWNDLGSLATRQGRFDAAIEAHQTSLAIYRTVYPDGRNQNVSVGLANLASVYLEKGELTNAEATFREAVTLSRRLLTSDHMNTAIAEVKLGHTLAKQGRYAEAVELLEPARATMVKHHAAPSLSWMQYARRDLVSAYEHLGRAADADALRAETPIGSK